MTANPLWSGACLRDSKLIHGHRRVHRAPGRVPGRRAARHRRPVPPARRHRDPAATATGSRGQHDGYADQEIAVLPGGRQSTIIGIDQDGGRTDEAFAPQCVALRLADDLDVSRGDPIAPVQELDAAVSHLPDHG